GSVVHLVFQLGQLNFSYLAPCSFVQSFFFPILYLRFVFFLSVFRSCPKIINVPLHIFHKRPTTGCLFFQYAFFTKLINPLPSKTKEFGQSVSIYNDFANVCGPFFRHHNTTRKWKENPLKNFLYLAIPRGSRDRSEERRVGKGGRTRLMQLTQI